MKKRNWFWGIFFILSAVFVVASQTGWFHKISPTTVVATILLAALLISSIAKREIFGIVFPLGFLYYIYQEPLQFKYPISWWMTLLVVILLSIGLSILFRKKPPVPEVTSRINRDGEREHWSAEHGHCAAGAGTVENISGEDVYVKVHFGASVKYLHSQALKSGKFDVSFGSLEVYFDNVQLCEQGAEILLDCNFSGVKLYIPRSWRVLDNTRSALSGVTNVNRFGEAPAGAPVLTLGGSINFSGVEILYV